MKTTNPGGRTTMKKEYFYECDVGFGGKRLLQPKISSLMSPGIIKGKTQEDTMKNVTIETHSVGQHSSDAQTDERAGIIRKTDRIGEQ